MDRTAYSALLAQYATPKVSGDGRVSWDGGVKCVIPSVRLYGKCEQETLTGKNLWTTDAEYPIQFAGIDRVLYDAETQTYEIPVGDSMSISRSIYTLPEPIPAGTTVTIKAFFDSGQMTGTISFGGYHNGTPRSWQGAIDFARSTDLAGKTYTETFVTTDTVTDFWAFLYGTAVVTEAIRFRMMYVIGDSVGNHEPYTGGLAMPSPELPSPVRCNNGTFAARGINLFPILQEETKNGVTLTSRTDGGYELDGTCTVSVNFAINISLPAGAYTLACGRTGAFPDNGNALAQIYKAGVILLGIPNNGTAQFTHSGMLAAAADGIACRIRAEGGHTYDHCVIYPLLVSSTYTADTMPPYVPYCDGGTAQAPDLYEIPGTAYRDELDVQTGRGVRHIKEYIFTGSEASWVINAYAQAQGINAYQLYYFNPAPRQRAALCTHFAVRNWADGIVTDNNILYIIPNNGVVIKTDGAQTLEDFCGMLRSRYAAGDPVRLLYCMDQQPFASTPARLTMSSGPGQIIQTGGDVTDCPITARYLTHS